MKKAGGLLLLGAVVAVGIYTVVRRKTKQAVAGFRAIVKDVGFDFKKTSESFFTKLYFPVQIGIDNTSSQRVKVLAVNVSLTYNGSVFAKGLLKSEAYLEPKKTSTIKFTVTVPVLAGATQVIDMIQEIKSGNTIKLNISGETELSVGVIKFDKDVAVNV